MRTQLRDLAALLKLRNVPDERVTLSAVTKDRTSVTIEFSSDSDAAEFATSHFGDAVGIKKYESEQAIVWQGEVTFRGHLYCFMLFVPKEQETLAQQRVN